MAQSSDDVENIICFLGDFGPYQLRQYILHVFAGITAGIHILSLVTVAAIPEHRCEVPTIDHKFLNDSSITNPYLPTNNISIFHEFIPRTITGELERCFIYKNLSEDNSTIPCEKWVFDTTYYSSSRAIEWGFVCDNRWMSAVAQASYMFGVLFGAGTLGVLADKIGRKPVFVWSGLLQLILGVGVAFVNNYYLFLIIRFFYGIVGTAGAYISAFVLTMELVGPSKRTFCGIALQGAFACGIMLDAVWGYFIKDRFILQIIYGLHSLLLIPHFWIMDESPRWLWSKGRIKESIAIIQKALDTNKRPMVLDVNHYENRFKINNISKNDSNKPAKSVGTSDLFRTPNLRYKTLNACFCFFANSICYYGLSLSTGNMEGNPFFIMFFMALVEMPSYALVILTLDRFGRRTLISSMMLVGGMFCLTSAYFTQGAWFQLVIVMLGKLLISGSFAIIYNYAAELFPTQIRNTAMGLGSMCARFAGMVAPFITLLDSISTTLPTSIFAFLALLSGFLTLFLPETNGKPMPQTIEEGELFGAGDTCFSTGFKKKKRMSNGFAYGDKSLDPEQMIPLEDVKKTIS